MNAPKGEICIKQLVVAPFDTGKGLTYSTLALSEDGKVYRYDTGCQGWYPWSMKIATCEHRK